MKRYKKYLVDTKDYSLEINMENIVNPREYANLGTMVCFFPLISIGDKHTFKSLYDFEKYLEENKDKIAYKLPIYVFDEDIISIDTKDNFSHTVEGELIGYIYVEKEKIKNLGSFYQNERNLAKILDKEVKTFNNYIIADTPLYSYKITDENTKQTDSLGVFPFFTYKSMITAMKDLSDTKYSFLFDSLLNEKENYL